MSLLLSCLVCAGVHGPVIYARDENGFGPVSSLDRATNLPVPALSRSERAQRIARTPAGIGVRIYSGSKGVVALGPVEVRVVAHASDSQVLREGTAHLVGPPVLPVSVARSEETHELLPWLARQDANGVRGSFVVTPPDSADGLSLVLIGPELAAIARSTLGSPCMWNSVIGDVGMESPAPGLARDCWIARTYRRGQPRPIVVRADSDVDQAFFARVERIDADAWPRLQLRSARLGPASVVGLEPRRGEGPAWPSVEFRGTAEAVDVTSRMDASIALAPESLLELWFKPPPDTEAGRTWTILLSVPAETGDAFVSESEPEPTISTRTGLFRDVAREVGIDMVHMEGPDEQLDIRPTMGPGAAWGDVDGDGWVDLFLPQGGGREGSRVPASRMYRNRGDGTFEDVSKKSGLALEGAGMGAQFLDVDGDADLDLLVANYGANRLMLNDGKGRFEDVGAKVGLAGERWHAGVAAADYDRDGDLDLYVTSYLRFDLALMPPAEELGKYQREDPMAMLPFAFPGERKTFLRNDRVASPEPGAPPFRLVDVTDELGLADEGGRGMQAIFWDFDRDGDQDLYLANDVSPNRFWRNEGNGTFKDVGLATGLDDPRGCMGLAVGDVEGDGDEDLFVTNWQLESNALYVNNLVSHSSSKHRVGTFHDRAVQAGLAQISVGVTKWGCELADFDLDGDLDLFYANGYTSPDYESTGICVGQPCHYFENDGEGRFTAAFEKAGPDAAIPLASRAAQACDYDQDGDLDLVVTANNGRVRLLRNGCSGSRSWLGVRLRGRDGNTHAIGAEVEIRAGERTLRRSLRAGASYLGGNPPELHFGLGDAKRVDACVVRWPSGRESKHEIEKLNAFVTLHEPDPASGPR